MQPVPLSPPSEHAVLAPPRASWTTLHLILFRFVFCFVSLYTLDLMAASFQRLHRKLNGDYPTLSSPFTAPLWHHIVPWIGLHVLHLSTAITIRSDVGQDSPYEYILRGTEIAIALLATILWSALDRSRTDYRTLDAWLRIFARAMLAVEMLFYGLAKVPPGQFGVLTLYRQATPLGELWPMAMLWAFMAASPGYTLLSGLVETAGGLLLLAPRTTLLGALLSAAAMANVLALNIFYDVNQKIRCVYYVLLALYLAAPQLPGLWRLLVLKQAVPAVAEPRIPGPRPLRYAAALIPLFFATLLVVHFIPSNLYRYRLMHTQDAQRGPFYGIWRATVFNVADPNRLLFTPRLNRDLKLAPGGDHWRRLILDADNKAYIELPDGDHDFLDIKQQTPAGLLVLGDSDDTSWDCRLNLQRTSPTTLQASGSINGNAVQATFEQEDPGGSHLMDSPKWVSAGRRW